MKFFTTKLLTGIAAFSLAALCSTAANSQTLSSNSTGTNNGFFYSFWKDSGSATMTLYGGGRYASQWNNSTNNWVGGKGWNPGNSSRVISYSGNYGGSNSQNTYLALYGWTRSPLIEYYVIESYGSYNPASCSGGTDYGSFQSDGATYNVRRCLRTQQPSIDGTQTFYQYFSVRNPKKGFGNISGTITFANHANFWASKGLNLGNHDYQIVATEGYQSTGSSDITVSQGTINGGSSSTATNSSSTSSTATSNGSGGITVRARGVTGSEHIYLKVGGVNVGSWTLTTSYQNYIYTGTASGDINIEYDNDSGSRDVQVDYIQVNGETRQAEDMTYNTALYANGSCGGGGSSELMHCNGVIGFGSTTDCFSGNCGGITNSSSSNANISSTSVASSVRNSSSAAISSTAISSTGGQCQCNWYGTFYPSCVTTQSGWGWEDNKSCISNTTCNSQPTNQGGLVCNNASSLQSSSRVSSSSVSSSRSSSSAISSSSLMSSSSLSRSSSSRAVETFVYAINAGNSSAATLNGIVYQPDRFASGGTTQTVTDGIAGTTEDAVYQSERYGTYSYDIPVSNATYNVVLHFAELYHNAAGARSFNLSIEGQAVLSDFDLYGMAGHDVAYEQRIDNIAVADGKLTINLTSKIDNGTLSGFAIYSSDGGTFTGSAEQECSTADRQTPTAIDYNRAVTRQEQKNPPSGAFGYAIEHATQTLPNHTIYRPDLSRANNIPIVVWGNGACSNVGTEQADFLLQIASNGYLVIANGGPFGSGSNDQHETELVKAIDWAVKENNRKCSQYYGKLNVEKIATMGWSCGGGMAHFAAVDPRVDTAVALNSGLGIYGDRFNYYPRFQSPIAIFNGDSRDVAYNPGLQEYSEVNNVPVYHANYPQGHGDAYYQDNGGEFGIVAVGWLNWQLKDDLGTSGKGMFIGNNCRLCRAPWVTKHKGF
ncbi:MAG TPA: glycoside hydrolase family 11 protein [Cellvibrio sp.]|nr:glycoside hydrolase family 11 protein [Cellvibrio sp.]